MSSFANVLRICKSTKKHHHNVNKTADVFRAKSYPHKNTFTLWLKSCFFHTNTLSVSGQRYVYCPNVYRCYLTLW